MNHRIKLCAIFLICSLLMIPLSGCQQKNEVSRVPIDKSYTAPYDGVETEFVYKYNFLEGEFVLLPETKTVHHDAVYKILYRVTYSDGNQAEVWETVTEEKYFATQCEGMESNHVTD